VNAGMTPRPCTEHSFDSHDGVALFYRHWPAAPAAPAAPAVRCDAIVMFHRGHEHSGRMAHLVDELDLPEFDFFAWDARGHGRSPGVRGFSPGVDTSVRDIQTFMDHLAAAHDTPTASVYVIAQSLGAVMVAAWVHDYGPPIRGMTLASPAFEVKLYVPLARPGIRAMTMLRGNFFVNSYVDARLLTHDATRIASFNADPLISRAISANMLLDLHVTGRRIVADAAAITVPTQLLISGSDWVVREQPQRSFFARLSSPVKELHRLPGFFHDTLGERDRGPVIALVRRFFDAAFTAAAAPLDVRDADQRGFTADESRALAAPLPAWSPRAWYWAITRAMLKLAAPLSAGLRTGHDTGFDSGSTLDLVYRNEPRGAGPIGRAIDKTYLGSIGWRGIRQRKKHVEELLQLAMQQVRARGLPVNVIDIAAGYGRYVLDAVAHGPARPDAVLLRDTSERNVADGSALVAERGLQSLVRFTQGDAFDRAGLAAVTPAPTVAVVSGLYELFGDNARVAASLSGLADAMPEGACLVYTCQPWHPQLELIARALTSHRGGQAWVMRRRSQLEMDQLVAAAGFRKVAQRIDGWGIFTVAMAVRAAA
jgi:alpha-beta hydrolase superfamily lysophospholipase/SAM-dependent methyltransferase